MVTLSFSAENKMLEKQIYKKRFRDVNKRALLWETLVKYYFNKYFSKKDVVLDLASGYCEFINVIDTKTKYALDINEDVRKYAKKEVKVLIANSTKIPLKKETISKVFISNFFEHISKEDILKTVAELERIVKKNGEVIVLQPNIRFVKNDYWMFFDHITPIDDRALIEVFSLYRFGLKKNIVKFLPYTIQSNYPIRPFLIRLYLAFPLCWRILGKQSLLVFRKK